MKKVLGNGFWGIDCDVVRVKFDTINRLSLRTDASILLARSTSVDSKSNTCFCCTVGIGLA